MRILVTGADGFVGRHAVAELLAAGHEVVAATQSGGEVAGARPLRMDVRDQHVVRRALESAAPDAILHLAAIAFVPDARKNPLAAFETNAGGTLGVLVAAGEVAPLARVVVVSSAEVYGRAPSAAPLREDVEMAPVTLYGASKAAAEHVARVRALEGQDAVVLRPFNHIGPGQGDAYVVPSFARQIAELERSGSGVLRHGNLDAVRDFLDVRDVAAAYRIALTAARGTLEPGRPYNVCSGTGTRIADVVAALAGAARRPVRTEVDPARLRPVDVPAFVGDPSRFRAATGFAPAIALQRTLMDVLEEARRRS